MRKKLLFAAERLAGCRRVLEIGAGRGLQLSFFLEHLSLETCYAGIDLAQPALRSAATRLSSGDVERVSLLAASAAALPFRRDAFDGLFCLDALHHVPSQVETLREASRVLRPGSPVICIEPNPRYPANLIYVRDPIEKKLFELTPANVRQWADGAGLEHATLLHLPVYFPSFPVFMEHLYERLEQVFGSLAPLQQLSTTRVLIARTRG